MSYRVELKKVRIRNFRSIVDETISFDQFNIFVGLNDCGKSNVLKALNLFFNNETENGHPLDFPRDYCQYGKTGKGKAKEIVIEVDLLVPENFKEKGIKTWKKVWRDNELFSDNLTEIVGEYSKCVTLFRRIRFEYIPAVKSEDFFKDLLLKLYNSMIHSADSSLLRANIVYSKSLAELTENLSNNVKQRIGIESIVKMPDKLAVLFRNLKISTKDENVKDIDLDHRGDGVKARHIPSILLTIMNNIKGARKKNSVDYTFIWGYEEPENGVEFFACSKLAEELYSYSSDVQIILTTHSPAIYSKNSSANVKCYYTYKGERGASKYEEDYSFVELNENIGLMPLIAPYIEDFQKTIDERAQKIAVLSGEVKRLKTATHKIVIYTEGKTDVKYLKLAFARLIEYKDIAERVEYYDIEHAKDTGDGELKKMFDYLQKGSDTNIKIFMFDRDVQDKIISDEFQAAANRVYRFNIPVPPHRNINDKIAIEHYLTDDDLSTIDQNGKKIFLAKEFDSKGITTDGKYMHQHAKAHDDRRFDPLEIINGSEDKRVYSVVPGDDKNYAMSKDDLVTHIEKGDAGFDFNLDAFKLILEVIQKIVDHAESKVEE